jgi:hypothetical protein
MTSPLKTVSALAIASATFASVAFFASSPGFAMPPRGGHGPAAVGAFKGVPGLKRPFEPGLHQAGLPGHHIDSGPGPGGKVISCGIGKGCTVTPPEHHGWDHDHDHDHDGWYHHHWRWDWYGWRAHPGIVVEGAPEVVTVPSGAPPVSVSGSPRVSVPPRFSAVPQPVAPQPAASPCNCLTKQNLPDGSVVFQDICTKETAFGPPPQALGSSPEAFGPPPQAFGAR